MRAFSAAARQGGRRIGFVSTMGALHAGHLSLLDYARPLCDLLVVSIFVNPLQFDRKDELDHYPRTWEADLRPRPGHYVPRGLPRQGQRGQDDRGRASAAVPTASATSTASPP